MAAPHETPSPYLPHRPCAEVVPHEPHEWGAAALVGAPFYCRGIMVPQKMTEREAAEVAFDSHPMTLKEKPAFVLRDSDSVVEMMLRQRKLQESSFGHDFDNMSQEDRVLYARNQILALLDETHEALAEIGWKPWATSRHMNRDAFVSELVDVWHFLMNLLIVAQVTPHEFFTLYVAKNEKNAKRQAEGYDGVSTKCPECHRAYDDTAVYCTPAGEEGDPSAWCEMKGSHI